MEINLKALATRASMQGHKYQTQRAIYALALLAQKSQGTINLTQLDKLLGHLQARREIKHKIDRMLNCFVVGGDVVIPVKRIPIKMVWVALYELYRSPSNKAAKDFFSVEEEEVEDPEKVEYFQGWTAAVKLNKRYEAAIETRNRAIRHLQEKCQDLLKAIQALPQMDFSISTGEDEDDDAISSLGHTDRS